MKLRITSEAVGRLGIALATCLPAVAQTTTRASVSSAEAQGDDESYRASISGDGRYVAFVSYATNLVAGDTNGVSDAFVRDRLLGTTERVSLDSGEVPGNGDTYRVSISDDGRYVAFVSYATNLAAGDTNGVSDAFVRDRIAGTTERVSVDSAEVQADGESYRVSISGDGHRVAFVSYATNLVAGDTNGLSDAFVRDRIAGTTERVSVDSGGAEGDDQTFRAAISQDGRYVAFESYATNLVAGDTNGFSDVFVRDRLSGTTERASLGPGGAQGDDDSYRVSISGDGRYVAFASYATNLVAGDANGVSDAFVRDRLAGTTDRASVDSGGAEGNGDSYRISISDDGRYLAFVSFASNLVAGDANGTADVFVRDRLAGTTAAVSVDAGGILGNGISGDDSLSSSSDVRLVAFDSASSNLAGGDTNAVVDIFVRDRDETGFLGFCYPDLGGARSCPCGNPATSTGLGCDSFIGTATVSGTGGARLAASGIPHASVSNTVVFHVTQAHNPGNNANIHVFWKGTTTLAVGVKSGFGVRCVAGTLRRIYTGTGTGTGGLGSTNAVDFPNGTQTTNAWTASQMPAAGTTVFYYDSFRDQQGPTTCNTANDRFNVSHAGAITWIP